MTERGHLDRALEVLVGDLNRQPTLHGAVLYGSAARGDWVAGRSDVNLLVVVEDPTPAGMAVFTPAVTAWHEAGFTPPLLIGRQEWLQATDVFPIEIVDMQSAYRVVAGTDPVAGLVVDPAELRRALEAALRGKLIRLRQAWVRFGDVPITLGGFAAASISELLVLLRGVTVLSGIVPGQEPAAMVTTLTPILGPDAVAAIQEVAGHRRDQEWACAPTTFVRYLEAVRAAVAVVDHHSLGDS